MTLFKVLRNRGYSKRALRRIKSEIISTRVDYPVSQHVGYSQPCNGPKCQKCKFILSDSSVQINDKVYYLKDKFDCNSEGVVYIIFCLKCNLSYVGQTGNPIRSRIQSHLGDILHNRDTSVARHFNDILVPHSLETDFRFCPIESVPEQNYRLLRESKLITDFDTIFPNGLNIRNDTSPIFNPVMPICIPYSNTANYFCNQVKSLSLIHI